MAKELELAWAAGFFDGEGTSYCTLRPATKIGSLPHRQLRAEVTQKEREPLDRFVAAIGMGKVYGPTAKRGCPYYANVGSAQKVVEFRELIGSLLCSSKRKQLDAAIAKYGPLKKRLRVSQILPYVNVSWGTAYPSTSTNAQVFYTNLWGPDHPSYDEMGQ